MQLFGIFENKGYIFEANLPGSDKDIQEWFICVKKGDSVVCERHIPLVSPINFNRPDLDELYGVAVSFADRESLERETDVIISELSQKEKIARIKEILAEIFEEANSVIWLNTPNPCIGNKTPQLVIDEGHADAVLTALENAIDGLPS